MSAYNFFLWGSRIAPRLPTWLGNALADFAGLIFYLVARPKRRAVMSNLAHVLPDKGLAERRKVARGIFRNILRNYYDLLRVHKIPQDRLDQMIEVNGLKECRELARQRGYTGIVAIAAHIGSFSLALQVSGHNEIDICLLVEPIKPPKLFELVRGLRQVDPHTRMLAVGGPELRQVFRVLKQPDHYVCIAIDRNVTEGGQMLRFFGADACLPTGTAEIALRTGAPIVPVHVHRRKDGQYVIDFHYERLFLPQPTGDRPADLKRVAEQCLAEVEPLIRLTPEQWVVLQPIWPD